jgi:hypothetical protein
MKIKCDKCKREFNTEEIHFIMIEEYELPFDNLIVICGECKRKEDNKK